MSTTSSHPGRVALALAGAALALAPVTAALAQDGQCQQLRQQYRQELDSAHSLKSTAAQQAVKSGSYVLSKMGIQLDASGDTQQAIRKGALAATSPQMQNAILIQLLTANTHLQELIWRGCQPGSGSSG